MLLIINISICLILLAILWQDLKDRAVHWILFMGMAICSFCLFTMSALPFSVLWANLLFILILMAGLSLYLFVKEGRFFNFFKTHMGIGDFIFFIAISPLFEPEKFILFFISGLLISAVLHLLMASNMKDKTIPLAGYLSAYLFLLFGFKFSGIVEPFYNQLS